MTSFLIQKPTLYWSNSQRVELSLQEFIEGPTLKQELDKSVYDDNQIWQLLQDLLPVLQFIHDKRVIHRDIKPENIIRRQSDNKLVLIDFGIAKLLTDSAMLRPATLIGSQDYVAPEQIPAKYFRLATFTV